MSDVQTGLYMALMVLGGNAIMQFVYIFADETVLLRIASLIACAVWGFCFWAVLQVAP